MYVIIVIRGLLLTIMNIEMPFYYGFSQRYLEYFSNGDLRRILSIYFTDNHIKQNAINLKLM